MRMWAGLEMQQYNVMMDVHGQSELAGRDGSGEVITLSFEFINVIVSVLADVK